MQNDMDTIYFNPGDVVTLKQDIPNKPVMIVVRKEVSVFKHDKAEERKPILIGIRCRWFAADGKLLEAVWNTKDLVLIEEQK